MLNFRLAHPRKKILISLAVLCGLILFIFRERWLLGLGGFLVVQDRLHGADVIHVIAGEDYRTDYAIELYQQGLGKVLFFTGGWCKQHQYHHGEHAEALALAQGLSQDAVAYDDSSVTSTYLEAVKLKEWMARNPAAVHSVIVVSDPFHMRRARWAFRKVFRDEIEVQMAPVPFERTPYQRRWWTNRESRINVREEYEKYAYYVLRYQISAGKFRKWLASMDRE